MTVDLSGGKPDSAYVSNEVKTFPNHTEESIRAGIRAPVDSAWGNAKGNFFTNIIGGMFQGISDILNGLNPATWLPKPAVDFAKVVRDGQEDLNHRADLLSPLLDYGSVCCPPGTGHARFGTGRMPFTHQIGPSQGVTFSEGRIRLDDKGLWDLRSMVTVSWTGITNSQEVQVWLRVLKPDGALHSVYSEQGNYMKTSNSVTLTSISSVTVLEPGYWVDVYVICPSERGWWTGPAWTRLTAQHISRDITGGTGAETSTPGSQN